MSRIDAMRHNPQFRQLRMVTDDTKMREIFQHQLPGFAEGRLRVKHLKIMEMHYEDPKHYRISYGIQVKDLNSGREGRQLLTGVVEPAGEAAVHYAAAQNESQFQPEFVPAVYFLEDLNMIVWGFPNDPELKQLHRLLDDDALRELLLRFWRCFHLAPSMTLDRVETKTIKYVPRHRCTLCHKLHLANDGELVVYSKTFGHSIRAEQVYKIIVALGQAPVCQSGDLIIPEPLFVDTEMNAVFVRGLEGASAEDDTANLDVIADDSGRVLAEIHQCAINGLPVGAEQGIMAKVVEAETLLADFDAELGSRVKAISEKLAAKRSSLTKIAPRSIHGAFRLSQLLRVTSGLALVDFDAFQLGNPMEDVGGFVAYLLYRPMKGKLTQQQSRSAIRHFCRAYAERSPWGLPKDVLAWQTTAHLVGKHAKRSVKTMKKNVRQLVEQLLRTAVDILDGKTSLT